jgi:hypothetical protein
MLLETELNTTTKGRTIMLVANCAFRGIKGEMFRNAGVAEEDGPWYQNVSPTHKPPRRSLFAGLRNYVLERSLG